MPWQDKIFNLDHDVTAQDLTDLFQNVIEANRGMISGLGLSNEVGDTAHDIEVAIGRCVDTGVTVMMNVTAAFVKQINADWAEGDDAGGLATGARSVADTPNVNTWYHLFLIHKTADGTIDGGFDTSLTATNLLADATGYSGYRRIGSVLTDGSSNIINFTQFGDEFLWKDMAEEFEDINISASPVTKTLARVPTGIQVRAILAMTFINDSPTALIRAVIYSPDQNTHTADADIKDLQLHDASKRTSTNMIVRTNTSGQIVYDLSAIDVDIGLGCMIRGYLDTRGKDD